MHLHLTGAGSRSTRYDQKAGMCLSAGQSFNHSAVTAFCKSLQTDSSCPCLQHMRQVSCNLAKSCIRTSQVTGRSACPDPLSDCALGPDRVTPNSNLFVAGNFIRISNTFLCKYSSVCQLHASLDSVCSNLKLPDWMCGDCCYLAWHLYAGGWLSTWPGW